MFVFNPEDIIILIGIIFITLQDPFREYVVFDSYYSLKKHIPYAIQNHVVFGIVWFIIYLLISVSVFLVFLERADIHQWVAYVLFSLYTLILSCTKLWTPIFFGLHHYILSRERAEGKKKEARASMAPIAHIIAFIDLVMVIILIICFIVFSLIANPDYDDLFWLPALFLCPSIVWLLYAGYLNLYAITVASNDIELLLNIKK